MILINFEHCVSEIIVLCSMVEVVSLNEQIIAIEVVSNLGGCDGCEWVGISIEYQQSNLPVFFR